MSNIECRPKALVIADALKLLDTDMRSPRDGAAELLRQHAEIERLRALTQCQCGDEFTAHDPGKCGNCCAGETAALHAEIERLTAERDEAARIAGAYSPARELQRSLDQSKAAGVEARKERDAAIRERDALRAEADGLHVNMAHLLNALGVPMDGKYMGAAVEQVAQLRAELEALRAQEPAYYVTVSGRLHLTDPTAALVRQMREALAACESPVDIGLQRRKAIAAADQWLAQQRGPLTDDEITRLMPPADGTAEANKKWSKTEDGFPCFDFDEVDAWSRDLVIATVRSALLRPRNLPSGRGGQAMTVTTIFRAWIGLLLVDLGLWAHGCDLSACRARSRKEMETWMQQNSGKGGRQC